MLVCKSIGLKATINLPCLPYPPPHPAPPTPVTQVHKALHSLPFMAAQITNLKHNFYIASHQK